MAKAGHKCDGEDANAPNLLELHSCPITFDKGQRGQREYSISPLKKPHGKQSVAEKHKSDEITFSNQRGALLQKSPISAVLEKL